MQKYHKLYILKWHVIKYSLAVRWLALFRLWGTCIPAHSYLSELYTCYIIIAGLCLPPPTGILSGNYEDDFESTVEEVDAQQVGATFWIPIAFSYHSSLL